MAFELVPGATIGILGGGQLGRMLALAAAKLGLKTHVYAQDPESPAFDVASARTIAAYEDELTLAEFAGKVAQLLGYQSAQTEAEQHFAAAEAKEPGWYFRVQEHADRILARDSGISVGDKPIVKSIGDRPQQW